MNFSYIKKLYHVLTNSVVPEETAVEGDYFNDPEFQALIREYLDYLVESLSSLQGNLNKRNYRSVQEFGHNLKGSGGGYGFDDLSSLGDSMEMAAEEEDRAAIETLIGKLKGLLQEKRQKYSV